jgi:hypothetical protein
MAVTPFKTFSAGEVLTAADLNSSFLQITDNGEDLGWPATKAKDLNGQELVLDADGDTSITADTDDQIDIKLSGSDDFTITANKFDVLAGSTLKVSGVETWTKGADVASAATLPVAIDGNYFDVTGTTTITAIATKGIGTVLKLHFDAALTLTHHATNLILPGGVDITTAAGDEAEFFEYAANDWRCTSYTRASGKAVVSSDWEWIESTSASASSTIELGEGNIDAGYDYIITTRNVKNSVDAEPELLLGTGAGPTYATSNYSGGVEVSGTTNGRGPLVAATEIQLTIGGVGGGATGGEVWGLTIVAHDPAENIFTHVEWHGSYTQNDGNAASVHGAAIHQTAGAITGFRLQPSTGNFTSGFFALGRRRVV